MKPGFSVIIPTHNRLNLLKISLESVIKQKFIPGEILISDNLCQKEVKDYVDLVNNQTKINIIYIGHKKGGRGAISRNLAAQKSSYNYLAFLDDDDLWDENYLSEAYNLIKKNNINFLYTWTNILKNTKIYKGKKIPENLKINDFFIINPGSVVSNLIIKKETYQNLNGFDETTNPPYDKDLVIRYLYSNGKYNVLKKHLVIFRNDDYEKESNNKNTMYSGYQKLYQKHFDKMNLFNKIIMKLKILTLHQNKNDMKVSKIYLFPLKIVNFYYRMRFMILNYIF